MATLRADENQVQTWFDHHGSELAANAGRVAVILVIAAIARFLLHRAINRLVTGAVTGSFLGLRDKARTLLEHSALDTSVLLSERRRQRTETLGSVLKSIASVGVGVIALAMILGVAGLDLTPIVASAGIVGVAVGFGAQNLVKDFLGGMFMLLEDQYGVGDVIDSGAATGIVEAVTLRTTRIRDVEGTVWYVRNGEIARVGNKSQGWSRVLLDVPLALDTNVPGARAVALEVAHALRDDPDFADKVLEIPEVWGLQSVGLDGMMLRITVKTTPSEQGAVERALRERLVIAFEQQGVNLHNPVPH